MNILFRVSLSIVLMLSASVVSAVQSSVEMVIPTPITVPETVSAEGAAKALRAALIGRSWVIDREESGRLEATLHIRQHKLTMDFTYTDGQIVMYYVDSSVLGYTTEPVRTSVPPHFLASGYKSEAANSHVPRIHPTVMTWLGYVSTDIKANLAGQ